MKGKGRYISFALAVLLCSFLALWTRCWYLLIFNLVLFDLILSRKIDWTLRKYGLPRKLQSAIEWTFIFLLAVFLSVSIKELFVEAYKIPTPSMEETLLAGDYIFVSKLAYGPRLPSTPLSLPFYHNQLPSGRKPYSEKISWPYRRLWGVSRVKRNDIIVFNFPEGDSMVVQYPGQNYYSLVRQYGRDYLLSEFDVISHPVDKRENFIKRCVALPGEEIRIVEGDIFIDGKRTLTQPGRKYKYYVSTRGEPLPDALLDSLKIFKNDLTYNPVNSLYVIYLTQEKMEFLRVLPGVRSIKRYTEPMLSFQNQEIFPHHPDFRWTGDHFGPLKVPAKGDSIRITAINYPLYQRIISVYEGQDVEYRQGQVFINGRKNPWYTFRMDYYFVMGDNHHNSADSRYWGFVPEDHLLGKAMTIWFSSDPEKSVLEGFRKERIFERIK